MSAQYHINWDDSSEIPVSYPPEIVLELYTEELYRRTSSIQGATELLERSVLQTPVPVVRMLHRNTMRMQGHYDKVRKYLLARKAILETD